MGLPSSIQLGPYQLHERIGEGGNGQVYRATGPTGVVAVKLIGASDLDAAARARFGREIAALGALSHPNLITLVDHGVDDELGPYLVLPLLAGSTLRDLWRNRPLCPEAAIVLLQPIAAATAALHAGGYVHRDLKPENAIAAPDGTITLIDLGLAWGDGMSRHTESGATVGSIGYMSPEQLDGRTVDARADVWALGVMIYECIVGKRPFARARPTEEVAAALLGSSSRLSAADRRTGEDLADLVAACLAPEPARRPSIDAVAAALGAMIDWAPPERIASERAAVIADPVGYQLRVAPFRVRRLERLARAAIDDGKPFAALALCDRGLAYVSDHPALVELIATAEAATAPRDPAPRPLAIEPPGEPDLALARTETVSTDRGDREPRAAVAVARSAIGQPRRRRIVIAAIVSAGIAAGALALVLGLARDERRDPWAPTATPSVAERSSSPPALMNDRDRELLHDFVGLFSMVAEQTGPGRPAPTTGARPTTASGWLRRAGTQEPAEAVASIRQALTLSPDWPDAQGALCIALAATKDPGALDVCRVAVAQRPDEVALRAARGSALVQAGDHGAALVDLDRVVAADPHPRWRRLRAQARAGAGNHAGATQDLDIACRLGDSAACLERR